MGSRTGPERLPIDRVAGATREELERGWLAAARPVILVGAVADWPAVSTWSLDWFRDHAADLAVSAFFGSRLEGERRLLFLGEAIERMRAARSEGEEVSIRQLPLASLPFDTGAYLRPPEQCPADRRLLPSLWLAAAGTVQPFHQDHRHPLDGIANLLAQVHGRKRAMLVSPDQDEVMYRRAAGSPDAHFSEVDAEEPDLGAHPRFRDARIWEGALAPGDLLFIPMRWWHSLCALDESVSVSFWWRPHRISDLTASLLATGSVSRLRAFLDEHRGTIGCDDVAELGGFDRLASGLAALSPELARAARVLLSPEVSTALDARPADRHRTERNQGRPRAVD
jgi:hypothetical protein